MIFCVVATLTAFLSPFFKVKVGQCLYEGYGNNPTSYRGAILPQQDGKDSVSGGLHVRVA